MSASKQGVKIGIYLDSETNDILKAAAAGMDRSVSWLVQQAIRKQVPEMARKYFNIMEEVDNEDAV